MGKSLLFLCTGNYYRSRFSEILFNHLIKSGDPQLEWHAFSRGLWEGSNPNPGPISIYTVLGLEDRQVPIDRKKEPNPQQVTLEDLEKADLVIAVDEEEHRPMMDKQFPDWADKISYWGVHDLHLTHAADALGTLEVHVKELVERLKTDTQ